MQSLGIDANNPIEITQNQAQDGDLPFPFPLEDSFAWDKDDDEDYDDDYDDDDYDDDDDDDGDDDGYDYYDDNDDDEGFPHESELENKDEEKLYDEDSKYDYE